MTASIRHFPLVEQSRSEMEPPSSLLLARVGLSLDNATRYVCTQVRTIEHADDKAKTVVMHMFLELVGRAASDPNVTVTELLEALYEHIPEGTREAAGDRR